VNSGVDGIRLGTRGSALALWQAHAVGAMLGKDCSIAVVFTSRHGASAFAAASARLGTAAQTVAVVGSGTAAEAELRFGSCFADRLARAGLPAVQAVQNGSVLWLYLDEGAPPRRADAISCRAMARFNRFYSPLLHSGCYLPPSPYEVFFLSTAHTEGDVDDLADAILQKLSEGEVP
jgi:glutamate-1-semialdehyde aminotransferase